MIIVIGATSFIGSYLTRALVEDGYEVLGTARSEKKENDVENLGAKFLKYDLSREGETEKLPKHNVEGVVLLGAHMPANSQADLVNDEDCEDYIRTNTIGTIQLLEYCRKNSVPKFISTTTYADFFNYWSEKNNLDENTPRGFQLKGDHCAYVISKNAATDLMLYYNNQYGMNNVIFRFPPVYGVGPHGHLFVNGIKVISGIQRFIDQAKAGEKLHVYGDASIRRDILYIKDAVGAFQDALRQENAKGLYNIASGHSVSLQEQAEAINDVFGDGNKNNILFEPERDNHLVEYHMSIQKAKEELKYNPKFTDFAYMMKDWKEEEEKTNALH